LRIHRVATCFAVFSYANSIAWILKHIKLENRYIYNARGDPIVSFEPTDLEKCYHLEKGTRNLDYELIIWFKRIDKYLVYIWYKLYKQFKLRLTGGYPTTTLRNPYQYMVAMLCRLYRDPYASKFPLSYMPLIHYCAVEGSPFN